ncbi:MAG: DUF4870 domain-containing protein [Anaerolineales bacterium]
MHTTPTTEDRVWTVLAHLSALSFGMGILLPVVGWSDQRRKSNYASFQCLQALGYQSVGFTIWVLSYLVIIILAAIILLATLDPTSATSENPLQTPGLIAFFIIVFGFFALYFVLPIIAAIACAMGKDFRYPLMGDRLAHYLEYDPSQKLEEQIWLNETHEFRWVAAMGHFSILIMLWEMLAPLTAWILQGKNSFFLKFQSIQTLVYQSIVTIIYFVGGFLYLFGIVLLVTSMGGLGEPNRDSSLDIIRIVVTVISLLVAAVTILSVPLLHILGQWAGFRILKGENYRYPLIGKLVDKWISTRTAMEEKPA